MARSSFASTTVSLSARDKQLGRKLQELAITFLLESTLGKDRILEIYLNIIEWGPELRGLRPAARHYFGLEPRELTPAEMAFLVAIIPGEECLRLESPNQLGNRLVSERVTIGGVALEAGTYLTLCIGAANRDPVEFAQPDSSTSAASPIGISRLPPALTPASAWEWRGLEAQVAVLRVLQKLPGLRLRARDSVARGRVFGVLFLPHRNVLMTRLSARRDRNAIPQNH